SNALIEQERAKAVANFQTAEEQRILAQQKANEAEENFRQACKAVEGQFTLVSQTSLFEVPGLQSLRKDLLENTLKYYQGFLEQGSGAPILRAEIAAAYLRLYQIYDVLDRRDEGAQALQKGLEILEAMLHEYPPSAGLFQRLAGFSRGGRHIHIRNRE